MKWLQASDLPPLRLGRKSGCSSARPGALRAGAASSEGAQHLGLLTRKRKPGPRLLVSKVPQGRQGRSQGGPWNAGTLQPCAGALDGSRERRPASSGRRTSSLVLFVPAWCGRGLRRGPAPAPVSALPTGRVYFSPGKLGSAEGSGSSFPNASC